MSNMTKLRLKLTLETKKVIIMIKGLQEDTKYIHTHIRAPKYTKQMTELKAVEDLNTLLK